MISAIVAVNNDWGIGYKGELLEHIPEDLKRFKRLTTNNIIVMGQKTWDSLPKKPLPNRVNIVITHTPRQSDEACFWNMTQVELALSNPLKDEVFIIGGGTIYQQLLPLCEQVYITKIYKDHENIDTYFPNLDKDNNWEIANFSPLYTYKDFTYQFLLYRRK